jgi:membrane protein
LALVFTIDRTLNSIWRVRRPRPLGQRVLVYWAAITLGPLLMALSVSLTSNALAASRGLVIDVVPGGVGFVLDLLQVVMLAGCMAALYRYMPNTHVKWGHAWVGGVLVAGGMELAKRLLAVYLQAVPTYSAVYGAFATVPILLVWIYVAWVIVLLGAVVTAYLPSLMAGESRPASAHGWQFQIALEVLQQLEAVSHTPARGLRADQLAQTLHVDLLQLEPVLEGLTQLDWIGSLDESAGHVGARFVMLAEPDSTLLAPLMSAFLLERVPATEKLWERAHWPHLTLRQAL